VKEKTVNLALIGSGRWGQNYVKTIESGIPGVSLPQENIVARNYSDLYSRQNTIDGVIVATPTSTHFAVAKNLLEKGFTKLLIEKPATQTLEQALALQEISEKTKALIMVGHIQLYDPAYQELRRHLEKDIGKIQGITYMGLQSSKRVDASVLQDWGPHPIYLFEDIMAGKPDSVAAYHPKNAPDDNVELILEFGDVKAVAEIGWTYPERKRVLEVSGENGSLVIDGSGEIKTLTLEKQGAKTNLSFRTDLSPLAIEIMEFAKSIKTGNEPRSPLTQGVEVVKIIEIAGESLESGGEFLEFTK